MQSNPKCSPRQAVLPQNTRVAINYVHDETPSFTGGLGSEPKYSRPTNGVDFQPSEICPRNFIIFNHTEDRSQIMFHPAVVDNLRYPPMDFNPTSGRENTERKFGNDVDRGIPSVFSKDSDDIDALLSLDNNEEYLDQSDEEEEVVSTARTQGYDGSSSPDSCSNYSLKTKRVGCPSTDHKYSFGGSSYSEGKRKKVQKMVKVLRGMVPGGEQMNTVAVLDEAVKYLKSMKVEVQKLGIGDLESIP